MKSSYILKLQQINQSPSFEFKGNQKGLEVGEIFPLYNLCLNGHPLNGSTITAHTIHEQGFKRLFSHKEKEVKQ